MIEDLIRKTNTAQYYHDSDLKLESYSFKTVDNTLEMLFSINQASYDIPIEYEEWRLTCKNVLKFHGFFADRLLPYVKMKILDSHPLLLQYNDELLECSLEGEPKNLAEFLGDINLALEKGTGNWITVNDIFWNMEEFYKNFSKRHLTLSKSVANLLAEVFKKHNLQFTINRNSNRFKNTNLKVLIFGNEDVAPSDFCLYQHFIIAEEFTAERVK